MCVVFVKAFSLLKWLLVTRLRDICPSEKSLNCRVESVKMLDWPDYDLSFLVPFQASLRLLDPS